MNAWIAVASFSERRSFSGWKASLFGDKHIHGSEGVSFYTPEKGDLGVPRGRVVIERCPAFDERLPVEAPRYCVRLPHRSWACQRVSAVSSAIVASLLQ
jgi:hypothetical protein